MSINYFLNHYSLYFSVTYNAIQSIVISTGYLYISFSYIICLSMSCHHTKDHNGNKGLPFVVSSLVLVALA